MDHTRKRIIAMHSRSQKAVTLPELLTTLTILCLILCFGVPSLASLLEDTRQQNQIDLMMSAIHFTRSEAIKQRGLVSICADQHGECQSSYWQHHLIIYKDLDGDGVRGENEPILRVFTLPDDYAWHWSNFRRRPYLAYQANGSTYALNGTLTLCRQDNPVHAIVINISGRTRHDAPKDSVSCSP